MSTRLIPGEKPRRKDIGTTSYKKPGPPTPSKNGGRMSLQGNEVHVREVLREHNDSKTPKRSTPKSTLRSLFMGRNSSVRDANEVQFLYFQPNIDSSSSNTSLNSCSTCMDEHKNCYNCAVCKARIITNRCTQFCRLKRFYKNNLSACAMLLFLIITIIYFSYLT